MKHLTKRLLALALSVAMAATMTPVTTAHAASKKSVTVSTQAELTKALKTKGVTKITIKTAKAVKFTVNKGKYSAKLEMNAPKASMTNYGTWSDVTVADAKAYTEKAKNNTIVVKDKKLSFTVGKDATVKSLKFAKKNATDTVKINGKVSAITISAPSTVKITDNGSLKKVTVDAKASVSLSGSSDTKVALTLTKKAADSAVKTAVPTTIKTSATVSVTLSKGAEGSAITVKSDDANVSMKNNTKKTVTVTTADGKKETVAAGEKLSTDSSDSSEKDEEKKEDEKKPTSGGGAGSWGSSDNGGSGSSSAEDKTPSLTLDKTSATLSKWDGTLTLKATAKNISGTVEWLSSNEAATVDNGVVTYVENAENVTITASAGGIKATCTVTTTDKVLSASGFVKAVKDTIYNGKTSDGIVTLGSDISGDVSLTWGPNAANQDLTIDMKNYTLNGNMTFTEKDNNETSYNLILKDNGAENIGAKITGNLTVKAPCAHVENDICVQGTTNIEAVANSTFQLKDKAKEIILKGPGKLDIQTPKVDAPPVVVSTKDQVTLAGNVTEVSVAAAADITVDSGTTVDKIEVQSAAVTGEETVTVKGSGTVNSLEAKARVDVAVETTELTASAPVVVSAVVTNVYVESDKASINIASAVTVANVSVSGNKNVRTVTITGSGTASNVDVTNATDSVTIAGTNIESVMASQKQKASIVEQNNQLENKIKSPKSIEIVTAPQKTQYYVGEVPSVTGASIKIGYSDNTTSAAITVTNKMIDVSAVKKDQAGNYDVMVSYAGLEPVKLVTLTYLEDSVVSKQYAANSMIKREYTREEMLDPSGVVVTLTYASGKTKQVVAGDSSLSYYNAGTDLSKTPLPVKSDDYVVEIRYAGEKVASQSIKVKPKYYTVKLNANENLSDPSRKETVVVEEFKTLNQLVTEGAIKLTQTLKPTAHENRMWTFEKWIRVEDDANEPYDWDTNIESDLNLIGYWDVKYPGKDEITIRVGDQDIKQGDFPVYTVKASDVHGFLSTVTASSKSGGSILIKYGIAGTSGDKMVPYEANTSEFVAGNKYEILYYTNDGDTFDGNWASILIMTQEKNVVFRDSANGIIVNCDGMVAGGFGIATDYINFDKMNIELTVTSAPNGVDINNLQVGCTNCSKERIYVQIHSKDKSILPTGTYTLVLTCELLGANDTVLSTETCEVNYTFDHVFSSKDDTGWEMRMNGDNTAEVLNMPYDSQKSTLADYLTGSVKAGSKLAYSDAANSSDPYKEIASLANLAVEPQKSYSIRVTNTVGEVSYFIFNTYTGVRVASVEDVNLNCIKMVCTGALQEPFTPNVNLIVTDDTDPTNPSRVTITQKMGFERVYFIWLNTDMIADHHYTISLTGGNVNGTVTAGVKRKPDTAYESRNTVTSAVIANDTTITVTMSKQPTGELWFQVMKQRENGQGWEPIDFNVPTQYDSTSFDITTTESLAGKNIRLCICGNDLNRAYDQVVSNATTTQTP